MSARKATTKATVTETPEGDVVLTATNTVKPTQCFCGCGEQVAPKRLFRPGHDARAAGVAARAEVAGDPTLRAALPTEALQAKAEALAAKWTAEAEAKAARKAKREAEAAAKA